MTERARDFYISKIKELRSLKPYPLNKPSKGIHSVFSGFNSELKKKYPGVDVAATTSELARMGIIEIRPSFKGVMIFLPGEAPKAWGNADIYNNNDEDIRLIDKVPKLPKIPKVPKSKTPKHIISLEDDEPIRLLSNKPDIIDIDIPAPPRHSGILGDKYTYSEFFRKHKKLMKKAKPSRKSIKKTCSCKKKK